jgi:hypothetical protein
MQRVEDIATGKIVDKDINPVLALHALSQTKDTALIGKLASETSLFEEATEMGQSIRAWAEFAKENPVAVLGKALKNRRASKKADVLKAKNKFKQTKITLKIEKAQALLDKLMC